MKSLAHMNLLPARSYVRARGRARLSIHESDRSGTEHQWSPARALRSRPNRGGVTCMHSEASQDFETQAQHAAQSDSPARLMTCRVMLRVSHRAIPAEPVDWTGCPRGGVGIFISQGLAILVLRDRDAIYCIRHNRSLTTQSNYPAPDVQVAHAQ